jgi:hypothetical protein
MSLVSGSSTWARTRDLRINSPALYQLSYRGIQPHIIASLFGLLSPNLSDRRLLDEKTATPFALA